MLLHAIALTGCIRDIRVPNPTGGWPKQIGCPADLSGNPCRNDELFFMLWLKLRIAVIQFLLS